MTEDKYLWLNKIQTTRSCQLLASILYPGFDLMNNFNSEVEMYPASAE